MNVNVSAVQVSPQDVLQMKAAGHDVLMVCAYDADAQKHFERIGIEGSISYDEFLAKLPTLPKDQSLVFYCDCPKDELAQEKTAAFQAKGYNAQLLDGGIKAWKNSVS